jgi:hypothetical protein
MRGSCVPRAGASAIATPLMKTAAIVARIILLFMRSPFAAKAASLNR